MQHYKNSFQNQNMFDSSIQPLTELNPLFSPEDAGFRDESEHTDDHFHELEDYFSLQEDEIIDYSKANRLNDYYRVAQGWDTYIYEINDLLLAASGQSGMSLYGNDFTDAVVKWQLKNGFSGKNADGIIGPESWKRMQIQLPSFAVKPGTAQAHSTAGVSASTISAINQYATIIDRISAKYGLDPAVTRGIIAAESGGNARSGIGRSGYKGLMQAERTTDQLNPDISIETGVKKFTEFQRKIFNPWLTKIGTSVSAINAEEYLKMCLSCYNAGPVTAMKAVQYAKLNGNINSWLQPENYLRALLFSGGYAAYDICSKGKSDTEIDAAKKERLKYKFKTSGWRTEQDPPAWSSVSGSLNPILKCWIETKFRNTPGYLDKFIIYYRHYTSHVTPTPEMEFSFENNLDWVHETEDQPQEAGFYSDEFISNQFTNDNSIQLEELIQNSWQLHEDPKPATTTVEGHVSWCKKLLSKLMSISLTDDNILDQPTKDALLIFQKFKSLPQTGKIDFQTERALLETEVLVRYSGTTWSDLVSKYIFVASSKIEDYTSKAVIEKSEITQSFRDPRKLWSFVLHHMAIKRRSRKTKQFSDPDSYLKTGAHFCIMFDGRIIQLHPVSRLIYHAQCLSHRSVAVEFEGNFPDVKGKWWVGEDSTGKDNPTPQQFASGKFLAGYLKLILGTTHIQAHRQSSKNRTNDPGPDIWYHVGQWSINNLGLTDGGIDFKCGEGNPILPEWRTWGEKKVDGEAPERSEMTDHNFEENESSKAVESNQKYSVSLGWNQFHDQINDLLLPFSGQSNVSLGEHDFAQAVAAWQRSQGFASKDCDGIIGPVTWRTMQMQIHAGNTPVVIPPSTTTAPGVQNILGFNQYYAGKILARMNQGILGSRFNSKLQLEAIAQGRSVLRVNPNSQIIQILPILYHIGEMAAQNNFREILIGSFIRDAASNGTCTGHCAGRCIDINHSHRDFADPRALQMVINILGYLNSLPLQFKKFLGFGMPFQGSFFTNKRLPKFRKASPGDLADNQLKLLVPTLGIVFPDNDNHLHIQVKWI